MLPKSEPQIAEQIKALREGHARTIARTLSQVEDHCWEPETVELLRQLYPLAGHAFVVGVTGSPGAGKSTLVDHLTRRFRERGKKVGIVAVDPTSPFTGGALLGDRVRMQALSSDPGVFIRSMATRGQLGGLTPSIHEALLVLDVAGFDVLVVETVGVGQDEVDIVRTADVSLVVLVPGMGDDIQTIKAGIMEIGDVFVVNKADKDGTLRTVRELEALLSLGARKDGWKAPVIQTVATKGQGVDELAASIEQYQLFLNSGRHTDESRRLLQRDRLLQLLRNRLSLEIVARVSDSRLEGLVDDMVNRKRDPYSIVDELVAHCLPEEGP